MGILEERHRKFLEPAILVEPLASYEEGTSKWKGDGSGGGKFAMDWSPDLIVRYQEKFIPGYALAQAWQELPTGALISIVDTVRNRLLRFALELREELGVVDDTPQGVPREKVDKAVNNYIFGGTNIIAGTASNFTQIGNAEVHPGDFGSLAGALAKLDISGQEIDALKHAIEEDKTFGVRTKAWLAKVGGKLGEAGLQIGVDIATGFAKAWVRKYFGGTDVTGVDV
jgi:hypothetical protein